MPILKNSVNLHASNLFYYPELREYAINKIIENVTISTEPTEKGKKELDIYHRLYCTKRIFNRKFVDFKDETWLKVKKAEKMGLITIIFNLFEKEKRKENFNDGKKEKNELQKFFFELGSSYKLNNDELKRAAENK